MQTNKHGGRQIYTNMEDYMAYASEYKEEEIEILALVGQGATGAAKFRDSWTPSIDLLAYVDGKTGDLFAKTVRLTWIVSDDLSKDKGVAFPYYLQDQTIYRLKVRAGKEEVAADNPYFHQKFMVVEVLAENVVEARLAEILEEYQKPVIVEEEGLGEFELDKDMAFFEGSIDWLGEDILVYVEVDLEDERTWAHSFAALRRLTANISAKDGEFRSFAAQKLTDLANDWAEEDGSPISPADFAGRIGITSLSVSYDGSFTAYYDDDDMFYGHAVAIYGQDGQVASASIAG